MKSRLTAVSVGLLLLTATGCSSNYLTNLAGSTGVAAVSAILSEAFRRLFQQI